MLKSCNERAHHCPTCSLELSPLEAQLLNADGCVFHYSGGKLPRASLWYSALQGLLDAVIFTLEAGL